MLIDTIKQNWTYESKNEDAAVKLWDEKADYFGSYSLDEVLEERFVKIIKENELIDKNSKILDVGCGAGKYCTALADDCLEAIGTDLSPKMVEYAAKKASEYGKKNVKFRCDNWQYLDIEKEGLYGKFDLIMACMTPAISSYETFMKFFNCGKNAGIYCSGTKRCDSISDKLENLLNIKESAKKSEKNIQYIFNILWENGYYPNIEYINQGWDSEMDIEKAKKVYINKLKAKYNITEEQEAIAKKYLDDINKDGMIYERIETTKAIIYWKK